jgi:hypothetical protein
VLVLMSLIVIIAGGARQKRQLRVERLIVRNVWIINCMDSGIFEPSKKMRKNAEFYSYNMKQM